MASPRAGRGDGVVRATDPRSGWWWGVGGVLLFVQLAAWALATPIFAGPDEPHHTFWAGAVVSGDLSGAEVPDDPDRREVLVAPSIVALGYPCFAFQPDQPASCEERAVPGGEPVAVGTKAARYPPLYYALVGTPLLADAGAASVYGARLLTALVVAALVTMALRAVRADWGPHLAAGLVVAVTPMVPFTSAIINPSALEVAANLVVWLVGASLLLPGAVDDARTRVAALGVAGAALVLSRPLSFVWLGTAVVALLVLIGWRRIREISAAGRPVAWATVVGTATALAGGWLAWSGFIGSATSGAGGVDLPFGGALRDSFLGAADDVVQLFGNFGWLDTPLPTGVLILWLILLGGVLGRGLTAGVRPGSVLVGLCLAVVVLPTVLQAAVLGTEGMIWQGRYSLPLAVGVPVVAGAAAARHRRAGDGASRWLGWVVVLAWLGHVAAFMGALRRYVVGIDGPYPGISGPWQPPLGGWALTALFATATAGIAWWVWASAGSRDLRTPTT